jgi:hypothetical protein
LVKDNYLHYFDGSSYSYLDPQRVIQNQYYGALSIYSADGWVFTPSFHYLSARYPLLYITSQGMNTVTGKYYLKTNGYRAGLSVVRSSGYLSVGLEGGYLDFGTTRKMQATFSFTFYPAGNSNIFLGAKVSAISDAGKVNPEKNLIEGFLAGFSIAGKTWIEVSGLTGNMNYYSDNNGIYIYNSNDVLKRRILARIIIPFRKAGISLYAGAGASSYSSYFLETAGEVSSDPNTINYRNINLTGGLSWNF